MTLYFYGRWGGPGYSLWLPDGVHIAEWDVLPNLADVLWSWESTGTRPSGQRWEHRAAGYTVIGAAHAGGFSAWIAEGDHRGGAIAAEAQRQFQAQWSRMLAQAEATQTN